MTNASHKIAVLLALAALAMGLSSPAHAAVCKDEPVEADFCAVQKPNQPAVQDRTIRLWQAAVARKYGHAWSSWANAKGRIRCRMVGRRTCCQAAAVPCRP